MVRYAMQCEYERAEALSQDMMRILKDEPGICGARDDSRGWDGQGRAVVEVHYATLKDAVRLDPVVRKLLGRKVKFTYAPNPSISYGGRPCTVCHPITTVEELP